MAGARTRTARSGDEEKVMAAKTQRTISKYSESKLAETGYDKISAYTLLAAGIDPAVGAAGSASAAMKHLAKGLLDNAEAMAASQIKNATKGVITGDVQEAMRRAYREKLERIDPNSQKFGYENLMLNIWANQYALAGSKANLADIDAAVEADVLDRKIEARWRAEKEEKERIPRERHEMARAQAFSALHDYELQDEEESNIRAKKRSDEARKQRDDDRRREARRSIASKRLRLDAYREFPYLKPLVDSGIIQKKELPKIAKTLTRLSKIPIIGHFIKHPLLSLATSVAGIAMSAARDSIRAAKTVTGWQASMAAGGRISYERMRSLEAMGVDTGGAIDLVTKRRAMIAAWKRGEGLDAFVKGAKFGIMPSSSMLFMDEESLVKEVARQASGIEDEGMRINALAAFGITPAEYLASRVASGAENKTAAMRRTETIAAAKRQKAEAMAEGFWSSVGETLLNPDWLIDLRASDETFQRATRAADKYKDNLKNGVDMPFFDMLLYHLGAGGFTSLGDEAVKDANQAAISADRFDALGSYALSSGGDVNNNNNTSIHIQNLNVQPTDAEGFVDALVAKGEEYNDRLDVMSFRDTKMKA